MTVLKCLHLDERVIIDVDGKTEYTKPDYFTIEVLISVKQMGLLKDNLIIESFDINDWNNSREIIDNFANKTWSRWDDIPSEWITRHARY